MRPTFTTLTCGLALVASLESGAEAGNILVFGDHAARADAQDRLNELGHHVVIHGALPADLSGYDVVWHVGVATQFDESTTERLGEFMKHGGGVFLSGEWECCETMNASVEQVVNRYVRAAVGTPSAIAIGGEGTAAPGNQYWNADAIGGITMAPHELVAWRPGTTGKIRGVQGHNILVVDEDGATTGAVWAGSELMTGGQLVVLMDSDWYSRAGASEIARNISDFLIDGVPPEEPLPEPTDWVKPEIASPATSAVARSHGGAVARDLDEPTDDDLAAGCSAGGGAGGLGMIGLLGAVALVNRKKRAV